MATSSLEERLTALEKAVTELQKQQPSKKAWWDVQRPQLTPEQLKMAEEVDAYGQYWRKTGQMPPDDWKPGDPIPEPRWDEEE